MIDADDPSARPAAADRPQKLRARTSPALAALVAFLLGAALVAGLAWHGELGRLTPHAAPSASPSLAAADAIPPRIPALEARLAMLEDRFARLDQQASAAAGNAGRAEGLLIAAAARRAIDRGQPLGYTADQLRLRFADTQPRAVQTLAAFAQRPVTLDTLDARLDALAPQLSELPRDTTSWARVQSALSNLFTIRRDPTPSVRPQERIERIKLMLAAGNVDAAADDIAHLPGAPAASDWIADAHRYAAAQQALDTIEGTAMIGHVRSPDDGPPVAAAPLTPSAGD